MGNGVKSRLRHYLAAWNRKDQDKRLFWITVGCWCLLFGSLVVWGWVA